MTENTNLNQVSQMGHDVNARSAKRALVMTILADGTVCTLTEDEKSDRRRWEK